MNDRYLQPSVIIALDDTDNADSIGTGRLGRMLAERLAQAGHTTLGVTRHQHLIHPDIPYTSHNSSCAIALAAPPPHLQLADTLTSLHALCTQFLSEHFHPGADPGLCVAAVNQITPAALAFAHRTQREVVTKSDAQHIARDSRILLSEHGGTGQGIIGALAAAALRSHGNDGRFLDLPGLRELTGTLTVREILHRTPIASVLDPAGTPLPDTTPILTADWVRPDLRSHRAILLVRQTTAGTWTCEKPDE